MKNLGGFKCPKCGWVHVGISEADAITAVNDFNENFATMTLVSQALFGGVPSSLEEYKQCFKCGVPAASFLSAAPGEAPLRCTLPFVIAPDVPRRVD